MTSTVNFEAIPAILADRPQWLVWRFEQNEGEKKPRKMPYYTTGKRRTGVQGSDEDRGRLVTLATARAAFEKAGGKWTGVGFAFLPGDGLIGVDLDGMIDAETGEISERGRNIITACASYTEFSPSGKGVHIITSGESETFKSNEVGVEVFCGRQYFTFTGNRYPDTPETVNPMPAKVLKRLQATVDSGKKRREDTKPSTAPPPELEGRAKVESALAYVSPNCGYDDWIHIGMAICAELGTGAFDVWDRWSAGGAKYPGAHQMQQHWKSFSPEGKTTGATIFKLAMDGGWQPPKAKREKSKAKAKKQQSPPPEAGAGDEKKGPFIPDLIWTRDGLKNCLSNVYQILTHVPEWRGVLGWDQHALMVTKRKPPPYKGGALGEWENTDDSLSSIWLSQRHPDWSFTPPSKLVGEAIEVLARESSFHPVREYLKSLKWDGKKRCPYWLHEILGVPITEYSKRVGTWWLMGAVARVLYPGCKFDYCFVLCGGQGKKKSSVLKLLAGEWFGDTDLDLNNKDAMLALRGKWIYEIAELGALARAEERRQKSFLSRDSDHFRPPYGVREIKAPRQLVFAGTTNEHEWNKDPTGGRRFWPVDCLVEEIDLEAMQAIRDQLWAEALARVEAGERYWPTQEEQHQWFDPEQLKVEMQDSLLDAIHDWVYRRTSDFCMNDVFSDCLNLDASKQTRDLQTRIGAALRKLGCPRVEKRNGMVRYWYKPPENSHVESEVAHENPPPAQQESGGIHAEF